MSACPWLCVCVCAVYIVRSLLFVVLCFLLFAYLFVCLFVSFLSTYLWVPARLSSFVTPILPICQGAPPFVCHMTARSPLLCTLSVCCPLLFIMCTLRLFMQPFSLAAPLQRHCHQSAVPVLPVGAGVAAEVAVAVAVAFRGGDGVPVLVTVIRVLWPFCLARALMHIVCALECNLCCVPLLLLLAWGAILITICSLTFHFAANTNMSTLPRLPCPSFSWLSADYTSIKRA